MVRRHFDGIVAWTQTRQTNGFIEALNGLFQAAKRKARGYTRFATMRTLLFLIPGNLDFARINPHAARPTSNSIKPKLSACAVGKGVRNAANKAEPAKRRYGFSQIL
jgi:Transposase